MRNEGRISIYKLQNAVYADNAPFHPSERYPESLFDGSIAIERNEIYEGLRNLLIMLELDKENLGKSSWNPLSEIIRPGDKVLIKPNMVREYHGDGLGMESMVTHASVIRALVDYAFIACGADGEITIADSPIFQSAEVEEMGRMWGITQIVDLYKQALNFQINLYDLRTKKAVSRGSGMVILDRVDLPGDPKGYSVCSLGGLSEFCSIEEKQHLLRGGDYDNSATENHHSNGRHEYLVANSALDADVIINVPKLKVHKKAGVTVNLKNMIGIMGDKNWIPHFMVGSNCRGGDEYPFAGLLREIENIAKDRFLRHMFKASRPVLSLAQVVSRMHRMMITKTGFASIRSGSWYGNDTVWRSIVDINKIVLFADKQGVIRKTPQRLLFSVVDGVIAGEKDGPLSPSPKNAGILCAGKDWTTVDIVLATYMGFDYLKIPQFVNALRVKDLRFTDFSEKAVRVRTNLGKDCCTLEDISAHADHFIPPDGWINFIEKRSSAGAEIEARE